MKKILKVLLENGAGKIVKDGRENNVLNHERTQGFSNLIDLLEA